MVTLVTSAVRGKLSEWRMPRLRAEASLGLVLPAFGGHDAFHAGRGRAAQKFTAVTRQSGAGAGRGSRHLSQLPRE